MRTRKGSLPVDQVSELKLLINETKKEIISAFREDLQNVKLRLEALSSRFTSLEESVASIQQKQVQLECEISNVKSELLFVTQESSKQTLLKWRVAWRE